MINIRQFDYAQINASDDASVLDFLAMELNGIIPNRANECASRLVGQYLEVDIGELFIQGRSVKISSKENILIPSTPSPNLKYLVFEINLNIQNTYTGIPGTDSYTPINNQASFKIINQSDLLQENLNNGGKIYQLPMGSLSISGPPSYLKIDNVISSGKFINELRIDVDELLSHPNWIEEDSNLIATYIPNENTAIKLTKTSEGPDLQIYGGFTQYENKDNKSVLLKNDMEYILNNLPDVPGIVPYNQKTYSQLGGDLGFYSPEDYKAIIYVDSLQDMIDIYSGYLIFDGLEYFKHGSKNYSRTHINNILYPQWNDHTDIIDHGFIFTSLVRIKFNPITKEQIVDLVTSVEELNYASNHDYLDNYTDDHGYLYQLKININTYNNNPENNTSTNIQRLIPLYDIGILPNVSGFEEGDGLGSIQILSDYRYFLQSFKSISESILDLKNVFQYNIGFRPIVY